MITITKDIILDLARQMATSQSAMCHNVFRLNLTKLDKIWLLKLNLTKLGKNRQNMAI
jgi:hypothetical protein